MYPFSINSRNGLGDRSHWRSDNPDLLIIEDGFWNRTFINY